VDELYVQQKMIPLLLSAFSENIPRNDPLAMVVWTVVLLVVPLAFLYCANKWARDDAEERKGSIILATILMLLFFPLGLFVWLLIRPKRKEFDFARYKAEHKPDKLGENTAEQDAAVKSQR